MELVPSSRPEIHKSMSRRHATSRPAGYHENQLFLKTAVETADAAVNNGSRSPHGGSIL